MLRLCVAAVLLASCWRGTLPATSEPEPFVARVNAVIELRHAVDALPPRLDIVEQRILGLMSEIDREAVRVDLAELAQDVVTLRSYASSLRAHGADPVALDAVAHKLTSVSEAVAELRAELVYAHTLAEQYALDQQSTDGTDESGTAAPGTAAPGTAAPGTAAPEPGNAAAPVRRRVLVRRPATAEPVLEDDGPALLPFTRRQPVRRELP